MVVYSSNAPASMAPVSRAFRPYFNGTVAGYHPSTARPLGGPSPGQLCPIIIAGFKDRRSKRCTNMKLLMPGIAKPMELSGRNYHGLPGRYLPVLVSNPNIRRPANDGQHLLDRMLMVWRAQSRIAKLLEYAELARSGFGRYQHDRFDAFAPKLPRLSYLIDYSHRTRFFAAEIGIRTQLRYDPRTFARLPGKF